jgi:hypothetical protein
MWRSEVWKALHAFHSEYRTAPLLIHVLRSAMEEWLQSESDIELSTILFPSDVRDLIIQQNAIGSWRQLFNGRFATEWSRLQQTYYQKHRTKAENRRRDGGTWQVQLIIVLWDQRREVWKLRNQDVHGQDDAARARAERASVSRELREVYDQRQHLEPQVEALLHRNEHDHLRQALSMNWNWIAVNLPIIRRSVCRVKNVLLWVCNR